MTKASQRYKLINQKKMHAYTYIYNAQEEVEMKFSCILNERKNWMAKKKEDVMYVDGGRAMAAMSI